VRFALTLVFLFAKRGECETIVLRGAAQGTTYHIKYVLGNKPVDAEVLQADVDRLLAEFDQQMSTYREDSEVSRFNRTPAGEWFEVSPAVVAVVSAAREISEKSGGAMDVTVGPLVRLWHFGRGARSEARGASKKETAFVPPSEDAIAGVHRSVGYKLLESREKPAALKKAVAGVEVDLSSIASGWTIDHLAQLLVDRDIENFMVELGGEVRAAGKREDGTPWRVAVERPTAGGREMVMAVPLVNAALATAGGTHKFFKYEGRRYSHIIDPSTGRPVEHALSSVTVAADTCWEADGWDTPLLVLGPESGVACAERNGIAAMFIEHRDGDDVREGGDVITTTAAWRKRFDGLISSEKDSRKGAETQSSR
jgi:thiamine biosynthesis lipoprotein